jgi:predicted DNA-binding transcriptional regulator YafY
VEHVYANGDIRVSIPLYVNYELRSTLLGFGKDIVVLKPATLRREMKEILQEAAKSYGKD